MFSKNDQIQGYDDELLSAINAEERRQEHHIELIASENYTSQRVMEAQGSGLTNKYAEGYPGKRYYGGCEYVDVVEQLAIDRAKQLFGADYANVQPHAGSQANAAVYLALLGLLNLVLAPVVPLYHRGARQQLQHLACALLVVAVVLQTLTLLARPEMGNLAALVCAALAVAVYVTKVPVPFMNKGQSRSAEQDAAEAKKNKDWDPNAPLYGKNPAKPAAPAEPAVPCGPVFPVGPVAPSRPVGPVGPVTLKPVGPVGPVGVGPLIHIPVEPVTLYVRTCPICGEVIRTS